MATKEEILQYIRTLASQQAVTKEEVVAAYDEGGGVKIDRLALKKVGIAEILCCIGGGIVFLGISILIWQNWSALNFGTKLLATLGAGVAAYVTGLLFSRDERTEIVGIAFFLISALVMPIGLYVVFEKAGFDIGDSGCQSLISGILFVTYLLSYILFRKNIFVLFSILFGTWLFFGFTNFLIGDSRYFDEAKFNEYRALSVGLAYILLGYAFSKSELAPLKGFLYGFGVLGFLSAALLLGGYKPEQNVFWELIFPGLTFGALFLSVYLKSTSFLVFGTLFLMVYIFKITVEYFSDSLGWPLALVIAGLAMIAIGYLSFYLKKKYLPA